MAALGSLPTILDLPIVGKKFQFFDVPPILP
jgi:hypothetical protein